MPSFVVPPPSYHDRSFERQRSDVTVEVLERAAIRAATRVLDVGCGAGQTLRIVERLAASAELIGLDPDGTALASGATRGGRIRFLRGEGERLPIADGAASHAICRVAINYMHQEGALRELARVVEPRGRIVLSFHALGYNLKEVLSPGAGGLRRRLGNLKDLLAGIVLLASGRQAARGTFLGRSVPHLSPRRLRSWLGAAGCEVTWIGHETTFLGLPTVHWAIVTRVDS